MSSKKELPKISIIMPVYNCENYLSECLDTIINQTLKEIELICVDDESTDSSLKILKEYQKKDPRIKVIKKKHSNAGESRNIGMEKAKGEYFLFLDSDDFFDLDLCKKTYERAKANDLDILLFGAYTYDNQTKEKEKNLWILDKEFIPEKDVFSAKDAAKRLFHMSTPNPWSKLYKRSFIMEKGLKFQEMQNSNDIFFVESAISSAERMGALEEYLVYYRVNQTTNLQSNKQKNPVAFLKAYGALYDYLVEKDLFNTFKESYYSLVISALVYNYNSTKTDEAKERILKYYFDVFLKGLKIRFIDKDLVYAKKKYVEYIKIIDEYVKKNNIDTGKISVIVPAYNAEKTIRKCLDSLINQTYKNMEIIVINDCSKDNTLEVLKEYGNKIVLINNEENLGPAGSRNKGLDIATGNYIGFVDSDDYVDVNMYEKMIDNMLDDVDLVACSRINKYKTYEKKIINTNKDTDAKLFTHTSNYNVDKLFKKSIIDKYHLRLPEQYSYAEDFYFGIRYKYYANKMVIMEDPFYIYVADSDGSITNSYKDNLLDIIDVLNDTLEFFKKENAFEDNKEELLLICAGFYSRRVKEFKNFKNKTLKKKYTDGFLKLFKKNFKHYKKTVNGFKVRYPRIYRTNKLLMKLYILYTERRAK